MDMKHKYINYIIKEFCNAYPTTPTIKFENKLKQASEDDLYRLANAIQRFGIENIKEAMLCNH